jgi:Asp-tRNA(Asn)/Glu-tRNA(Gln) amidotransferase A subunit family amidase
MTAPNDQSAAELARAIADDRLSSQAVVEACLERIAARDGEVRAFVHLDPEAARQQAKAADDTRRHGAGIGPLHGVPVAIKDIIDTADLPTENGSPIFAGRRPTDDAAVVARLRAAGAIILGKTVTTECAHMTPGVTRNPRHLEHTPGGSSSGSAAAVADGMVPLALATQTGGSVIRPASFCGIYGFKPTHGLISRVGVLEQAASLDTIGVYGRSVEDLALITDVLAGYDSRDPASFQQSRSSLHAVATSDWKLRPMFAFVKSSAWAEADAATREAFGELVDVLGPQVEEISIDESTRAGVEAARIIQRAELAHAFGKLLDRSGDLLSPGLAAEIEAGRRIPAADYLAAKAARERLMVSCNQLLLEYGTILTPAAPGPAPRGIGSTGNPVFNAFWTYLGVPAVTLPLLDIDGMPQGVQLVGARRDDGRLLRTARQLVTQLATTT